MSGNFDHVAAKEIPWLIFGPVGFLDGLTPQEGTAHDAAVLDGRFANRHSIILHEELNHKEAALGGIDILSIAQVGFLLQVGVES